MYKVVFYRKIRTSELRPLFRHIVTGNKKFFTFLKKILVILKSDQMSLKNKEILLYKTIDNHFT